MITNRRSTATLARTVDDAADPCFAQRKSVGLIFSSHLADSAYDQDGPGFNSELALRAGEIIFI